MKINIVIMKIKKHLWKPISQNKNLNLSLKTLIYKTVLEKIVMNSTVIHNIFFSTDSFSQRIYHLILEIFYNGISFYQTI